ncbi:MAG: M81 family metallopeptidase [Spirochaetes bacterium]|nr:M81 family metallopeptidase [Spirochaetota bacterium]
MRRILVLLVSLSLTALSLPSCAPQKEEASRGPVKTIAIVELLQESNSFSSVPTTEAMFRSTSLLRGANIIPFSKKEKLELGGCIAAIEKLGRGEFEIVPVLKARSMSGGPLERALYDSLKKEIVSGLKKIDRLDGVYLSLHGAMGVQGLRDPEGDLLAAIRSEVSATVPVGVTFDLHANITQKRMKMATFIIGYRTNPHRDHYDVGYSAGEIIMKTIRKEVKPVMAWRKMKLLKGGGMNVDFLSPMRPIFKAMRKMEKDPRILSVSNFPVHIWLDDPELGWSTVAVTDGDRALAEKLADKIAEMNWEVRDAPHPHGSTPREAIAIARSKNIARMLGTVVFCDASDAVGTGTPGESTWILKSLVEEAADLVSYVPVRDGEAAARAYAKELNENISVSVGGKLDKTYNRPFVFTGILVHKSEGRLGKTVILRDRGVHLIITEQPDSTPRPSYFTDLGLSLWKADIVVVKNLFPFRFFYLLYNRKTVNVMTPGLSNVDVFSLDYRVIPRPIYPLDKIDSWR